MDRREFLAIGAATLGAACSAPAARRVPAAGAGEAVPIGALRRLIVERVDPVLGRCRYVADLGGRQISQPVLLARRGERFEALVENRLPQPTTVHFHGLTLPEAQDGAGFDAIAPGATKALSFEVKNRSGLYWFHPHAHGFTAEQVYSGLVGLLVVVDAEDAALDAALALGPDNRLALAVSDVRAAAGAIRPYAPSAEDCLHGWFGNRALVNAALDARRTVAPGWVRLQLLNACNARGLLLAFRRRATRTCRSTCSEPTAGCLRPRSASTGCSSIPLSASISRSMFPGAGSSPRSASLSIRATRPRAGGSRMHTPRARAIAPLAAEAVCSDRASSADALPDGAELGLFTLQVAGSQATPLPPLPAQLSTLPEPPQAEVRRLRLDFDEHAGFLIDNTPYRAEEIAFSVERGAREVWEVRNSPISMPHPMHLHGFGFRVLRRRGTFGPARALAREESGLLPTDLGVKDTVVVWPNETLWLAVDFALPDEAAFRGRQRYMFHCHNLEHEDGMMMRNFAVL